MERVVRLLILILAIGLASACGGDGPIGPERLTLFACESGQSYTIGRSVSGALTTSDCLDPVDEAFADYYRFTQAVEGPVALTIRPAAATLIIALADSAEDLIDYEFANPGQEATIGGVLPPGDYIVIIAAGEIGQTATYTLSSVRTEPPGEPPFFGCATAQTHTLGSSVTGELATSDCRTPDGSYLDRHDFTVATTRSVTLSLSAPFDTYLYLFDGNGSLIAWNDDTDESLNSQLTITLQPGMYAIGASSYLFGATGSYTLTTN